MNASLGSGQRVTDQPLPALFRWFPQLREQIAWLPLGRFPTPVEPIEVRSVASGMFVKRDDLAGIPYGGNKVRKLEFVLAEAKRQGAERLITAGAAGSHHALATAVYGRALGFKVSLVLFPQPLTPHVREVLLLDHAYGAEIRFVPRMETIPLGLAATRHRHRSERCFTIAPGGSDAVGTLGYVSAGLELAEQISARSLPAPATVHLAAGTLGTCTGLALGFALANLDTRVSATRITSRILVNRWALGRLARSTTELLRHAGLQDPRFDSAMGSVEISSRQIGRGYGYRTEDADRAAEVLGDVGLDLDPTYTAKAAVDFLDRAQYDSSGASHLFWHTLSSVSPPLPPDRPETGSLPEKIRRYLRLPG